MRARALALLALCALRCNPREALAQRAAPSPPWQRAAQGIRWSHTQLRGDDGAVLEWLVVRLEPAQHSLTVAPVAEARFDNITAEPGLLFAVNAGFFNPDQQPSGLLAQGSRTYGALTPTGGSGVLRIAGGRAALEETAALLDAGALPPASLAVQCGPRLLERDGSVGIYRDDGRRFARTAACLRDGGRTLDVVLTWLESDPLRGPTLYWFARALAAPSPVGDARGCDAALNLDGGPSTGAWLRGAPRAQHAPPGPVPWALVVR